MTQKALLQSAGDGTAVPAGYVGERLTSANLFIAGPTITDGVTAEIGTGTSRLTLNSGVYLLAFGGDGNASDGTTRFQVNINAVSGSIDESVALNGGDSFFFADSAFSNVLGFQALFYVRIATSATIRVRGTANGGSVASSRLTQLSAVRIA